MCGIIGAISNEEVKPFLLEGLRRLEYRGYDSIGIALIERAGIERRRTAGRLEQLEHVLSSDPVSGVIGIGHTRWATHGVPNEQNAHPHLVRYQNRSVAIVHNGIIENFVELKKNLRVRFTSDTDSEVIAHLLALQLEDGKSVAQGLYEVAQQLRGAFACVVLVEGEDEAVLYGLSRGSPLAVGLGEGQSFLASDGLALAGWISKICYMQDGDFVRLTKTKAEFTDFVGTRLERGFEAFSTSAKTASKEGFESFMRKEIHEQPAAIRRLLEHYVKDDGLCLPALSDGAIGNVLMIGCGGSIHAAMVARYWIEKYAKLPAHEEIGSEFRDRHAVIPDDTLIIFISQSGETADTLAAFYHCQNQGHPSVAIVNQAQSTLARSADLSLMIEAGQEIGVAATKSLTSQMALLALCALQLAKMDQRKLSEHIEALKALPALMAQTLLLEEQFKKIAKDVLLSAHYILHLGRGAFFPIALEGALKSKEITYIPSEGYAAGEMKHGPIAMIDESTPVIALVPYDELFEKTFSNLQEIHARGGKIVLISDQQGIEAAGDLPSYSISMPSCHAQTAPILYVMAVQFLSYYVASLKGLDADRPRNLAKSVTVE